jgi:hypothetical protein
VKGGSPLVSMRVTAVVVDRYVPLQQLSHYGFTDTFTALATSGFPDSGRYVGRKANIGL